jgi:hypothetical protein
LHERLSTVPEVLSNRIAPDQLAQMPLERIVDTIRTASAAKLSTTPIS